MDQVPSTCGGCPPWDGPWVPVLGSGPGWEHKARAVYLGTGGVQHAEPFLEKKGGLGHTVHPPKSWCLSPASPALELPGFEGRAMPSGRAAQVSKITTTSPAAGGAAGFPCFPASPSLNKLKQTRRRTLGQCWVPAGAAAPNQTGGGCFRAQVGGGWHRAVRAALPAASPSQSG